jgi:hypothetical protein
MHAACRRDGAYPTWHQGLVGSARVSETQPTHKYIHTYTHTRTLWFQGGTDCVWLISSIEALNGKAEQGSGVWHLLFHFYFPLRKGATFALLLFETTVGSKWMYKTIFLTTIEHGILQRQNRSNLD